MKKETAPTFSVVNGKVMRATSTARAELRPVECAAILNDMLAVLQTLFAENYPCAFSSRSYAAISGAIAKATGCAP